MDKYYIPEIEEFYIGFEYERFVPRANATEEECWNKLSMSVNYLSLDEIDDEIIEKEIRVKYLSQEDIESLGFKRGELGMGLLSAIYEYKNVKLLYSDESHALLLSIDNKDSIRFIIKNKSELIKLLKQLEIE